MNHTHPPEIRVTGRRISITEAIESYARDKIESINIDFPKVIDAHVILDVQKYRHRCEIVLSCSNHIRIEADTESDSMYASIDLCISKLARQMRKHKTKVQQHVRQQKQRRGKEIVATE